METNGKKVWISRQERALTKPKKMCRRSLPQPEKARMSMQAVNFRTPNTVSYEVQFTVRIRLADGVSSKRQEISEIGGKGDRCGILRSICRSRMLCLHRNNQGYWKLRRKQGRRKVYCKNRKRHSQDSKGRGENLCQNCENHCKDCKGNRQSICKDAKAAVQATIKFVKVAVKAIVAATKSGYCGGEGNHSRHCRRRLGGCRCYPHTMYYRRRGSLGVKYFRFRR